MEIDGWYLFMDGWFCMDGWMACMAKIYGLDGFNSLYHRGQQAEKDRISREKEFVKN